MDMTWVRMAMTLLMVVSATQQLGVVGQQQEGVEKIGSFSPPEMTAEETDSTTLPRHLRCDGPPVLLTAEWMPLTSCAACRAISYQMDLALTAANKPGSTYKTKKGKTRMKESVYLEVRAIGL